MNFGTKVYNMAANMVFKPLFLLVPYAGIIRIRFNGFNLRHCVFGFYPFKNSQPPRLDMSYMIYKYMLCKY